MQTTNEKMNIGDKIADFVQQNRKGIFISFSLLVLAFIGLIAYFYISDSINKKAIAGFEDLNTRFMELGNDISEGLASDEVENLLSDLTEFTNKNKNGIAASMAWSLIGTIYIERKEWIFAQDAWLNSARTGDKTFMGPIALFQAAAINEEIGKIERAIELYTECVNHKFEFPAAARAQMSIGRLYEEIGDYDSAKEAFRAVMINWKDLPDWQNLARSRIIAIDSR